jgi:hypothetical protein
MIWSASTADGHRSPWKYELSADAIGLGLDAALPPMMELKGKVAEFGRGERI